MVKRQYVSIMGTMGSGKTTVARLIADKLKFQILEENFGENAFLPRFYQDMKRWAFHSQTFFLMEKTRQLLEAGRVLNRQLTVKDPRRYKGVSITGIVQDTPIQQDAFSYAKALHVLGHMDDAEWRLYQKIYHSFEPMFPVPDLIVYLETPVSVLEKRIESRGRGYEQKIPTSYLELLDMLNKKWLSENKDIPVIRIETDALDIVKSQKARLQLMRTVKLKLKTVK